MLRMEYCNMLRRLRVFLGQDEIAYILCRNRDQADQIFHAMQTLADKLGYPI